MTPVVVSENHHNALCGTAIPNECQRINASSGTCSLFLLSSRRADSRVAGFISCEIQSRTRLFSSVMPISVFAWMSLAGPRGTMPLPWIDVPLLPAIRL
jgi:hypothetical protein